MNETITRKLIGSFRELVRESQIKKREVSREVDLFLKFNKVLAVYGVRRVGKTFFTFQLIKDFFPDNFVYLDFDDFRVPESSEVIVQASRFVEKGGVVVLDEIQNVPGWGKAVRALLSMGIKPIVTGSSYSVKPENIPQELGGRVVGVELLPLSYNEVKNWEGWEIEEYLEWGGLPEVVLTDSRSLRTLLVREYVSDIFKREIKPKVRNYRAASYLLTLLLNSTFFSANSAVNSLSGAGIRVGKATILRYAEILEKTFLFSFVDIFGKSIKSELQYPRKVYVVDNSYLTVLSRADNGRLLENLVFNALRRSYSDFEIKYWRNSEGYEVDFVLLEGTKVKQLIQVVYSLEDERTRKRELRALLKASRELACNDLLVLTWDEEGEEEVQGKRIKIEPVWKWLQKPV